MRIVSINTGRPRLVGWGGSTFTTAINKAPIDGPVRVGKLGVDGDHQAHADVHGGPEMAVCVYPREHYAAVGSFLACELPIPSFGENFTTEGLLETAVCIGDIYRIGSATFQVSHPRQPCNTLARKHGNTDLIPWIIVTAFCGWYFRVSEPGNVAPGDAIEFLDRPHPDLTVRDAVRAMFIDPPDAELAATFAGCEALTLGWRRRLERRAAAMQGPR